MGGIWAHFKRLKRLIAHFEGLVSVFFDSNGGGAPFYKIINNINRSKMAPFSALGVFGLPGGTCTTNEGKFWGLGRQNPPT